MRLACPPCDARRRSSRPSHCAYCTLSRGTYCKSTRCRCKILINLIKRQKFCSNRNNDGDGQQRRHNTAKKNVRSETRTLDCTANIASAMISLSFHITPHPSAHAFILSAHKEQQRSIANRQHVLNLFSSDVRQLRGIFSSSSRDSLCSLYTRDNSAFARFEVISLRMNLAPRTRTRILVAL